MKTTLDLAKLLEAAPKLQDLFTFFGTMYISQEPSKTSRFKLFHMLSSAIALKGLSSSNPLVSSTSQGWLTGELGNYVAKAAIATSQIGFQRVGLQDIPQQVLKKSSNPLYSLFP